MRFKLLGVVGWWVQVRVVGFYVLLIWHSSQLDRDTLAFTPAASTSVHGSITFSPDTSTGSRPMNSCGGILNAVLEITKLETRPLA